MTMASRICEPQQLQPAQLSMTAAPRKPRPPRAKADAIRIKQSAGPGGDTVKKGIFLTPSARGSASRAALIDPSEKFVAPPRRTADSAVQRTLTTIACGHLIV